MKLKLTIACLVLGCTLSLNGKVNNDQTVGNKKRHKQVVGTSHKKMAHHKTINLQTCEATDIHPIDIGDVLEGRELQEMNNGSYFQISQDRTRATAMKQTNPGTTVTIQDTYNANNYLYGVEYVFTIATPVAKMAMKKSK